MSDFGQKLLPLWTELGLTIGDEVCNVATLPQFMNPHVAPGTLERNTTSILRIQRGRLLRGVYRTRGNSLGNEGRTTVFVGSDRITIHIEVTVPYAAIHEYGGTINQTVTKKQAGYLAWKGIAYKRPGDRLTIRIRPRPYLNPAAKIVLEGEKAEKRFQESLDKVLV